MSMKFLGVRFADGFEIAKQKLDAPFLKQCDEFINNAKQSILPPLTGISGNHTEFSSDYHESGNQIEGKSRHMAHKPNPQNMPNLNIHMRKFVINQKPIIEIYYFLIHDRINQTIEIEFRKIHCD